MKTGREFLQEQVHNATEVHKIVLDSMKDHAEHADDDRFREVCARHLEKMFGHQRMLESYRDEVGKPSGAGISRLVGAAMSKARGAAEAFGGDDFGALIGDIVGIRQTQDIFGMFAATGDQLGEPRLAEIGRHCERDHDEIQRDMNRVLREIFTERVRAEPRKVREAAD